MKNSIIWKLIIAFLLLATITNAQILRRHVISSGGNSGMNALQGEKVKVNCTIGQTHIGLLRSYSDTIVHGVGYWYNAWYIASHPNPVSVVYIPLNLWGEIGEEVSIPLILRETRYFDFPHPLEFEAKIRYNMTILQPTFDSGLIPIECNMVNKDECVVTVEGTMNPDNDTLAKMDFLVRLGSVDMSSLIIDSFVWKNHEDVIALTEDGEIKISGICREGDTLRLVKRNTETALFASNPNPASDQTLINYSLAEKGYTKVILTDNLGREISVIYEGEAEPGYYSVLTDLTDIGSGLYYITLITPTERFTGRLLVKK
jgi:hypothetical protein